MSSFRIDSAAYLMAMLMLSSLLLLAPTVRGCTRDPLCEELSDSEKNAFSKYFNGMRSIYGKDIAQTSLVEHMRCGWSGSQVPGASRLATSTDGGIMSNSNSDSQKQLPVFVLSVGLEGAGHHLYSELFAKPVFDCVWINGAHYDRDISDGVPKTSPDRLEAAIRGQLKMRPAGLQPCTSIFDAEDSFPTGAIRKPGRVFMHPDIVNLHKLDGKLFNIKYLLILRNTTDTALSALRRNFVLSIEEEVRAVEMTLAYVESAIRRIPCHKVFVAHYEHILGDPMSYLEPLTDFLELEEAPARALRNNLNKLKMKRGATRSMHKLTQYAACSDIKDNQQQCYDRVTTELDRFFNDRGYMWPTFAGNGFNFKSETS